MGSITVHDVDVWHEQSGPEDGGACVLVHGWTSSVAERSAAIGPLMGFPMVMPGSGHAVVPDAEDVAGDDNPQALDGILRDFPGTLSARR